MVVPNRFEGVLSRAVVLGADREMPRYPWRLISAFYEIMVTSKIECTTSIYKYQLPQFLAWRAWITAENYSATERPNDEHNANFKEMNQYTLDSVDDIVSRSRVSVTVDRTSKHFNKFMIELQQSFELT